MKQLEGFFKIASSGGSLVSSTFYNPITKETKRVITDDLEYQYGDGLISRDFTLIELETIHDMYLNNDALKQYNIDNNIPFVGAKIEVIKGRKYTKGSQGIINQLYDYKDKYNRFVAVYCITDNGMKINTDNVKILA